MRIGSRLAPLSTFSKAQVLEALSAFEEEPESEMFFRGLLWDSLNFIEGCLCSGKRGLERAYQLGLIVAVQGSGPTPQSPFQAFTLLKGFGDQLVLLVDKIESNPSVVQFDRLKRVFGIWVDSFPAHPS